jgi:hypothetical protein
MPLNPQTPMTLDWYPSRERWLSLKEEFGDALDMNVVLRRFRNHHVSKGSVSRNWEAAFENWVLTDYERVGAEAGTDDLGIPRNQRKSKVKPLQPGDEGYFNPADFV